jgi:hypothetical protein
MVIVGGLSMTRVGAVDGVAVVHSDDGSCSVPTPRPDERSHSPIIESDPQTPASVLSRT